MKKKINPSAALIIINQDKALILRRGITAPWFPGRWNLPGGTIEKETPEQAAKRESQEEIGFAPNHLQFHKKIKDNSFTLYLFITHELISFPRLNYENDAFMWSSNQDLNSLDFVPYIKEELSSILK